MRRRHVLVPTMLSGGAAVVLYTISGTVYDTDGSTPIASATVALGAYSTTSAANGTYTISGVPAGTSGSMTCTKSGASWAAISVSAMAGNLTNQNYTATYNLYGGLIDYWKMDETTGNRQDSVGARHLVPQGTINYTTGKISNCMSAPGGATDYLVTASDATLTSIDWAAGFSVWAWVFVPSSFVATYMVIGKANNGSTTEWFLSHGTDGSCQFTVPDSASGQSQAYLGAGTILVNTWYFMAGRYNPTTKKAEISINGGAWTLGAALTNGPKNAQTYIQMVRLGANYGKGYSDEVGMSTRYLPNEAFTALYNGGTGLTYPF